MLINRKIYNYIDTWVLDHLHPDFKFRKYQKEIIARIVQNIAEKTTNHNYVVEAPTGSGKTLIFTVSAGVLAEFYNIWSYILCSDLQLWEQYERAIKSFINVNFATIKGQTGNYTCEINNEDMRNADCRMCGISWQKLYDNKTAKSLGYSCAKKCKYVQSRKKCVGAPVVLTTYQLFLYQMNSAKDDHRNNTTFTNRQVIFCDECHNIPDIIQTKMTPMVEMSDFEKLNQLYTYAYNEQNITDLFFKDDSSSEYTILKKYPSWDKLERTLVNIFKNKFANPTLSKGEDYKAINEYVDIILMFKEITNDIQAKVSELKQNKQQVSVDYIKLYKTSSALCNYICYWDDFINAIELAGYEYILKNIEQNVDNEPIVKFSCVKEDWMIQHYMLSQADHRVLASATIGNKKSFEETIGVKYTDEHNVEFNRIPSTFNYDKSPIRVYTSQNNKMTAGTPENISNVLEQGYEICKAQNNKRGIIQSGNYVLAKRFYDDAPPEIKDRLIIYNKNKEKIEAIEKLKKSENGILIGPTLNEGVDLPDDYCRFNIILKVPFPNMGDKLVIAKRELFPKWYDNKTITSIVQGIGRGVRNENDWCDTYILDSCFLHLYKRNKDSFPANFNKRITYITQ